MAISKLHLITSIASKCAIHRQHLHIRYDILHLTTIGACIHHNRATDASRYTCSELHACKSRLICQIRHARQNRSCLRIHGSPIHPDFTHGTANLDNQAIISGVCKQDITSISKYTIIKLVFLAIRDQCLDFSRIFRHCKILCRPANAKCRMLAHRLLLQYFNLFYLQTHTFLTKINIKKPISSALS